MKQETKQDATPGIQSENNLNTPKQSQLSRRKFVEMTAASANWFLQFFPRHVLGGKNYIPPSDKITLAYIGVGNTRQSVNFCHCWRANQFHVVAVCDPNKEAVGYKDWGKDWLKK
jgi:hypothetical protein